MFDPNVILYPTDFSDGARPALRFALRLARQHDATLHLLYVAPGLGEDPIRGAFEVELDEEAFLERLHNEADRQMDALLDEAGADDVHVERVVRRGIAPGEAIVRYAGDQAVDLVVMGTHGRRGVARALLGSVAAEVVRQAPCSVLTVRNDEPTPSSIGRVLAPVDLSQYTEPLIRTAKDVTASFGASLDVLHVVEPLPFPVPLVGAITLHDLVSDPTDRSEAHLERILDRCGGLPVTVRTHVEEGHAAMTILDVADEIDAGLIVIASHGLSGLERMLLGSVTARIVRRASCPVLTVRVTPEPDAEILRETMLELLHARGTDKTICPSEVARAAYEGDDDGWRRFLPEVRAIASDLAREGVLNITQDDTPVDPDALDPTTDGSVSGPVRLGLRDEQA